MTRNIGMAVASITVLSTTVAAHPGHLGELGMAHVLSSAQHVMAFLLVGAAAAVLMTVRRLSAVLIANGALALFLVAQGFWHGMHGGFLFGAETVIAGAVLSLGAWRATHMVYKQFLARRAVASVEAVQKTKRDL